MYLEIDEFMMQIKDGSLHNVGPPTKTGTVKLFDVEELEARAFGDNRIKIECTDESGNAVQIALSPHHAERLMNDVIEVRKSGEITGFSNGTE